jgi:TfoX/Sxy family transcriptional regulator of competence genes
MEKKRKASPVRKWGPASDAWLKVFTEVSAGLGESRKMFGYPCAFVNGNMFAGLHESGMILRLPESERKTFLKLKGSSQFEPMPGRFMREYVVAPADMAGHPGIVAKWLSKAYAYGSSLPAKARKAKAGPRR